MKRYYSIRYEVNDGLHKAGERVFNSDNVLHIGHTETCEVRLANDSQYEDAVLAVIEKRAGDEGWKLIRMSPYKEHEVRVNGMAVDYVHFLHDGDRIAFEGQRQELLFNVRQDELYNSNGVVMAPVNTTGRALKVWMAMLTLVLVFLYFGYDYQCGITSNIVEKAKTSVFQINVDSVKLVKIQDGKTVVLESCPLPIKGIAFLTDDSRLVTARHCIEPWLNIPDTLTMDTVCETTPPHVRMALKAVTNEFLDDGARLEVVSVCSVYDMTQNRELLFKVESTDFIMDKSRDLIVQYGDFRHRYVWRSISGRPRRDDMMLGDIAYLPVDKNMMKNNKGVIHLASDDDFEYLSKKPQVKIAAIGCSEAIVDNQALEQAYGMTKKIIRLDENNRPKSVIAHDGEINKGYSGGPILTKQGFRWYAIGVVSVTDKNVDCRYYSVPVSEINKN